MCSEKWSHGDSMKQSKQHGFTRVDLLAVIATLVLLALIAWPLWINAAHRAKSICCNCNLKQIGLSFRIWSGDHTNNYPMSLSTNAGGTAEFVGPGETFRHFQVMSNELSTPFILVCPDDLRYPATNFESSLSDSNLSYFIGLDGNESNPQGILSGDCNITNGTIIKGGILKLTTNQLSGWSAGRHVRMGNIAMTDGSVQQVSAMGLRQIIENTGLATNRLQMP